MIRIGMLFRNSWQLIRADYVVILPYLISSFILMITSRSLIGEQPLDPSGKLTKELLIFYSLGWLITLLAQATTIFMANKLSKKVIPDIASSFIDTLKHFPLLSFLMIFSMLILISLGVILSQFLKNYFVYAAIPLVMFTLVFFQLFPVIILLERTTLWNYFKLTINFIKNNISNTIRFFLSISIISLFTLLLIALLDSSGAFSKDILAPLLQGLSGASITLISVVFYQEAKSTFSVNA
ncbi:hypothetical protein ACFL5G_03100 [Candidatus Margulisiibacteriota bacterium]